MRGYLFHGYVFLLFNFSVQNTHNFTYPAIANGNHVRTGLLSSEPSHAKNNNLGLRPGPTNTGLYSHRSRLGA